MRKAAWGTVPDGSIPISFAPNIQLALSAPPRIAALSITGATDGCTCRAPKHKKGLSLHASRHFLEAVAHPDELAKHPKIAVSKMPKSSYLPFILIRVSFGLKLCPSSTAQTS